MTSLESPPVGVNVKGVFMVAGEEGEGYDVSLCDGSVVTSPGKSDYLYTRGRGSSSARREKQVHESPRLEATFTLMSVGRRTYVHDEA